MLISQMWYLPGHKKSFEKALFKLPKLCGDTVRSRMQVGPLHSIAYCLHAFGHLSRKSALWLNVAVVGHLVPPLMDIVWELLSSQHSTRLHLAKVSVRVTLNVSEAKENIWGSLINFLVVPRNILCYGILGSIFKFLLAPRFWGSLDFQVRSPSQTI